jgi:hypothetical protein
MARMKRISLQLEVRRRDCVLSERDERILCVFDRDDHKYPAQYEQIYVSKAHNLRETVFIMRTISKYS